MQFTHWLLKRLPDSDKITAMIQQAGPSGIPENELRSRVDLPKKLVDELLQALVSARVVRVYQKEGKRYYVSM
jgi:hypothetical protein